MPKAAATPVAASLDDADEDRTMFGRTFWLAYVANLLLMVGVSTLFRYADFVRLGGGTPFTLGLIVGVGMIGSLLMRGVLGTSIDHYGAGRIWALSLVMIIASLLLHLTIGSVNGPLVYVARIALMVGQAGAFGASLTFVTLRAPSGRTGEMVGMLGSSGFIGLAVGPILGDWLFATPEVTSAHIRQMFLMATTAAIMSLVCVLFASRGESPIRINRRRPPMVWLLRRYHPGPILICAAAMGIGVMMPHTFVRPYTQHLGLPRILTFFVVYAAAAFSVRILTRRFTDRFGIRPIVQLGFAFLALSLLSFLLVDREWLLVVPASIGGVAHAFLFPAIVTGGSLSFPTRYRGLATTLVLAMFDIANLIGQPIIGGIIEYAPKFGLPGYATMFVGVASVTVVATGAAMFIRDGKPSQHLDITLPPSPGRRMKTNKKKLSERDSVSLAR
jgi:MFS family permease